MEAYYDKAWFTREQARLFGHRWHLVAAEEELAGPGDYVTAVADMKQGEWDDYHRQVSAWERDKYLLAF